jgi:hypothetical protein
MPARSSVELDPVVWKNRAFRTRNPGDAPGGCLYIGVTGLTPEARFSRLPYRIAACMEPKLAAWLRAQGFAVWQN